MAHFILINLPERQHLSLRFERTQIPASIIRPSDIYFLAAVFTTSSARTELSPHFFDQFGFSTIDKSTNTSLQSSRFNSMILCMQDISYPICNSDKCKYTFSFQYLNDHLSIKHVKLMGGTNFKSLVRMNRVLPNPFPMLHIKAAESIIIKDKITSNGVMSAH